MGGKKKSQVVGFKYYSGASMVLCQNDDNIKNLG